MSLIVKVPGADFSNGVGFHRDPFVAPADLAMGYDFRDYSRWTQGFVAGQTAVAYLHNWPGASIAIDPSGVSRSADGLGLALTSAAAVNLGYAMPIFSNNDGVGKTIMVLAGADRPVNGIDALFLTIGFVYSNGGIRLSDSTTGEWTVGAGVMSITMQQSLTLPQKTDRTNMIFLRANGNGTWAMYIPNVRQTAKVISTQALPTDANLNVSDPVTTSTNAGLTTPGAVWIGYSRAANISTPQNPQTSYQTAIWNRALTDAEVQDQYVRSRLRFPGVLN